MNTGATLETLRKDQDITENSSPEGPLASLLKQLQRFEESALPNNFREFRKVFERCLDERRDQQDTSDSIASRQKALE